MIGLYVVWNLDRRTDHELPLAGLTLSLPESLSGFLGFLESLEKGLKTGPSGATRDAHEKFLHRKVEDNQPRNLEALRRMIASILASVWTSPNADRIPSISFRVANVLT